MALVRMEGIAGCIQYFIDDVISAGEKAYGNQRSDYGGKRCPPIPSRLHEFDRQGRSRKNQEVLKPVLEAKYLQVRQDGVAAGIFHKFQRARGGW